MDKRQQAIEWLNGIVRISKDAEEGYLLAAEEIHSPLFQDLFLSKARERGAFASQIQKQVRRLGARPATDGSFYGLLHRGWMNLRYQLNLHHDEVVLKECLRGENAALSAYQDILLDHSLPQMEPLLQEQLVKVIDMRDTLRSVAVQDHNQDRRPGQSILKL